MQSRLSIWWLVPSPGTDWTNTERAQINRLYALCRKNADLELACDRTDAGDPWCAIYDRRQQQIILHIARIDRRYIVVWPPLQRPFNAPTIKAAIEMALARVDVDDQMGVPDPIHATTLSLVPPQ